MKGALTTCYASQVRKGFHPLTQKTKKKRNFTIAIFHASTKPISRNAGRSAVAASAYRAGERIKDERTGLTHNYSRKHGVVSADIITPNGQSVARAELWNMAESSEKRKDARTAREWIVALPAELDEKQRKELATGFGKELASRYGIAVDIAIHLPDAGGNNRNHHAHILTTTRKMELDDAGAVYLGDKASIELSDKKRRSLGLGAAADEIKQVRNLWQETANTALEKAGVSVRIDARSLKDQGIDREPTTHMGYIATEMERRGLETDRGDNNRQVERNNALREEYTEDLINYSEIEYVEHTQKEKNKPEIIKPVQAEIIQPVIAQPQYKTRKEFVRAQCLKADKLKPQVMPLLQKNHQTRLSLHELNKNLHEQKNQVDIYQESIDDYKYQRENAGFFAFKEKKYLDNQITAVEQGLQKAKAGVEHANKSLNDAQQSLTHIEQLPQVKEYLEHAEFYQEMRDIEEAEKPRQQEQEIDEDDDYEFEYD